MMLRLSEQLAVKIEAHASESYPHECCGALLGRAAEDFRVVLDVLPLVNRRADSRHDRFSIAPEDVRAAESVALAKNYDVVGWYHSHPDHPARPSEYDREHAWPWYSYVIVGVEQGVAREIKSWQLGDDRSGFDPEPIEVQTREHATAHSNDL